MPNLISFTVRLNFNVWLLQSTSFYFFLSWAISCLTKNEFKCNTKKYFHILRRYFHFIQYRKINNPQLNLIYVIQLKWDQRIKSLKDFPESKLTNIFRKNEVIKQMWFQKTVAHGNFKEAGLPFSPVLTRNAVSFTKSERRNLKYFLRISKPLICK